MDNLLKIKNNETFVLEKDVNYTVSSGAACVYIAKFINDVPQKRVYITEINQGNNVVGIHAEEDGSIYKLIVMPTAETDENITGDVELLTNSATTQDQQNFLKLSKLRLKEKAYEQTLTQYYLLMQMKESRNIYVETLANENAIFDSEFQISKTFNNKKSYKKHEEAKTSDLYFALSKIASVNKINHASYDDIKQYKKQNEVFEAFKKNSECTIRSIILEDDWFKRDIGSFVAYYKDTQKPAAVIFRKNKYYIYDINSKNPKKMTKADIDLFDKKAYSVVKTFPKKALKLIDIFKFLKSVIPFRVFAVILAFGLFTSIIGLILPYISRLIYDKFIPNQDLYGILGCATVLFCTTLGTGMIGFVNGFASFAMTSKVDYALQIAFFDRVFNLKESFIKKYEPAELSKRIMGISSIFLQISSSTFSTFLSILFSFVYLFQMISFMPELTGVAVVVTFVICAITFAFVKAQNVWYKKAVDLEIKKSSMLFQILRGINKIRITGTESRLANRYVRIQADCTTAGFKLSMTSLLLGVFTTIFGTISSILFYTIMYGQGFSASIGTVMGFFSAFGLFSAAIYQLPSLFLTYLEAKPWFTMLKPIIEQEPENTVKSIEAISIEGNIDIRHLTFSYDNSTNKVLDDISMQIKPGEYVGIVGESGCGKTTLLKLLLGFEQPTNGKIFYDNHDFDSFDKVSIRKNFGVVLQDGDLISGTIKDNLTAACPDATLDDITDALKKVDLWEDVSNMPMGIHTVLSEGSGLISGGQKQRILIARAIISKPKILFLDEATSSLDNISQANVCANLDKIGCTRVVIAHRLSTIIECDKIYVIDGGKIIQSGTYEELSMQEGKFKDFIKRQTA